MNFVTLCRILTVEYQLNIGVAGKILGEFGYKENKGGGWRGASLTCGEGGSWEALANQAWRVNHIIVDT